MIFQFYFVLLIGSALSFFFAAFLYFSADIHHLCIALTPSSEFHQLYKAIVCGKKLGQNFQATSLKQLGLVHIVVISGAHLLFFSKLIKTLSLKKLSDKSTLPILFLLVCCSQFQMPALRAWIMILVSLLNKKLKLFNSPPFNLLLSIIFCLSINPQSYFQLSLPLSWLASIAIAVAKNSFSQSFLCYLLLTPILTNIQLNHPWVILVNSFLTPFLCLLLFPLSLLSFLFSPFTFFVDQVWQFIFYIHSELSPNLNTPEINYKFKSPMLIWLYPSFLNLLLIHKNKVGLKQ